MNETGELYTAEIHDLLLDLFEARYNRLSDSIDNLNVSNESQHNRDYHQCLLEGEQWFVRSAFEALAEVGPDHYSNVVTLLSRLVNDGEMWAHNEGYAEDLIGAVQTGIAQGFFYGVDVATGLNAHIASESELAY